MALTEPVRHFARCTRYHQHHATQKEKEGFNTMKRKQLKHDESESIDMGLLIAVINQIELDVEDKDFTAIECLFQYLDDPVLRLKNFLRGD